MLVKPVVRVVQVDVLVDVPQVVLVVVLQVVPVVMDVLRDVLVVARVVVLQVLPLRLVPVVVFLVLDVSEDMYNEFITRGKQKTFKQ